jgi:Protein of unknown function (DUF3253)
MNPTDKKIAEEIISLLLRRDFGKTICPSEVARSLYPDNWRDEMEHVRTVARELVKSGKIVITQGGQIMDPDLVKGAIRLRLK